MTSGLAGEAFIPSPQPLRDQGVPDKWRDAADSWLYYLQSAHKAENTISLYQLVVLRHYYPWLAGIGVENLGDVTTRQLREWLLSLERQGLATSSIGLYRAALQAFYKFLVLDEIVSVNPLAGGKVPSPKAKEKVRRHMPPTEVDRLVRLAEKNRLFGKRDSAILAVLYSGGARVGELCGMNLYGNGRFENPEDYWNLRKNPGDVDLAKGKIFLGESKTQPRWISIGDRAVRYLDRYINWRSGYLARLNKTRTKALFIGRDGEPLQHQGVREVVRELGQMVGLPELRPHDLRHASAAERANTGATDQSMRDQYGWSLNSKMPAFYTRAGQQERSLRLNRNNDPLDRVRR